MRLNNTVHSVRVSAQRFAPRSSRRLRRARVVVYLLCVLATMYCLVQAVPCSGAITVHRSGNQNSSGLLTAESEE